MIFGINTARDISKLSQITYNNFEISLVVFMPNITTNHGITYTYFKRYLFALSIGTFTCLIRFEKSEISFKRKLESPKNVCVSFADAKGAPTVDT